MIDIKNYFKELSFIKKIRKNKWQRYSRRMLFNKQELNRAINNPNLLKKIVNDHINRNKYIDESIIHDLDNVVTKSYISSIEGVDIDRIKLDMLFYYFAYGFTFNEYLCYDFYYKDFNSRMKFCSDRDSVYVNYELNDISDLYIFNDKMLTYETFKYYFKREAISLIADNDYIKYKEFKDKNNIFVKKEVDKACGESVELVDSSNIEDDIALFKRLISNGKVIIEQLIYQGKETSLFNDSSVNTVRCITVSNNDEVETPYFFMKIGRKGKFVDNGGAGGILVGIDSSKGYLCTDGVDEYGNRYKYHPDSKVEFNGYQLPKWDQLVNMCKEMALTVPTVKMIGWDLAYTINNEWILVEGNSSTEFIGPQSTFLLGIRDDINNFINS